MVRNRQLLGVLDRLLLGIELLLRDELGLLLFLALSLDFRLVSLLLRREYVLLVTEGRSERALIAEAVEERASLGLDVIIILQVLPLVVENALDV